MIYRAYGRTYFNRDVYFPERVAALNRSGALVSFVAVGKGGEIAGHYALECEAGRPVAETGQAVVNPAHRGRGLLRKLKDAALAEAKARDLHGVFAEAVTVHTITQKGNLAHGAALTCADLGISPRSEHFVGIAPCFVSSGDLLRLVYLTAELDPGPIQLKGDFAKWLVGYALEQHRRTAG